jgi:hypothetical protein
MGTDIHILVQRRDGDGWLYVDVPPFDAWSPTKAPALDPTDRNYLLFSFLAGVRDRSGTWYDSKGEPREDLPTRHIDENDFEHPAEVYYHGEPDRDWPKVADKYFRSGSFYMGYHDFREATLQELRRVDWRSYCLERFPDEKKVVIADYAWKFMDWLFSNRMSFNASEAGGEDKIRIIFGFDS